MSNVLAGIDLSKFKRRAVDMSIPENIRPLQERVYEEAEKQARAMLGHSFEGLSLESEQDLKSTEMSFDSRVSTILNATLRRHNYIAEQAKKK